MSRLWILSVSLVLGAWLIDSRIPPRQPPLVNFDHSVYFDPEKVHSPSSKEEIFAVVNQAIENGRHIRVVGVGHSRLGIAHSDEVLLFLHKYTGVFKFDEQTGQVTVRGGTTLAEIVQYLDDRGLALPSLPAIIDQTITGAISTGTHGTGPRVGNLATMVTALELITGEGDTLSLSADNHPDIFKAALVSVGMLGVITKVTLQSVPAFNLRETLELLTMNECFKKMSDLVASTDHIKLWTELYSSACAVISMNKTTEEPSRSGQMKILDWKMRLMEPFLLWSSWFPGHTPFIMRFIANYINIFPSYSQVDKSYNVLVPSPYFPTNNQLEVSVAMSKCVSAIQLLHRMTMDHQLPANLITEVRFVAKDDIWLSPGYEREGCYLTLMLYGPSSQTIARYFDAYYQDLVRFGYEPRVHFGKYFKVTPPQMYSVYPQLHDFMEIRQQLDPNGLFLNKIMRDTFGLS